MSSTAAASLESLSLEESSAAQAQPNERSTATATGVDGAEAAAPKAKKKKKKLTPAQKRARDELKPKLVAAVPPAPGPVLKISRNKHMKYISSYHGPWLQLPHEVLSSFLQVNCDSSALPTLRGLMDLKSSLAQRANSPPPRRSLGHSSSSLGQHYPAYADPEYDSPSDRLPPPIDPAVFRGVSEIRKLVDEASDLAVRAASGFASSGGGIGGRDDDALLGGTGTGRQARLSPVRIHRMRALAVGKLAQAYRIDEIAASVAVMQGATGLDDLAQRVLKYDPGSLDAQYVQFFHEKIPSRTLAASTDTTLLDNLILSDPNRLEFYRTRGIVHGFKQEYPSSIRNFTAALTSAKALRKQKEAAANPSPSSKQRKSKKPMSASGKLAAAAAAAASWDTAQPQADAGGGGGGGASVPAGDQASSIGHEAGDDLERQMLFHRGMAHFHYACKTIEDATLDIEEVAHPQGGLSNEGGELTLRNVGIVLKDEVAGLVGNASPKKLARYKAELNAPALKDKVNSLLRKSLRDMERFLAYFAIWEAPPGSILEEERKTQNSTARAGSDKPLTFRGRRLIHHRSLSGRTRGCDPRRPEVRLELEPNEPALLTTYHPLLIEAHFSVLVNLLLLGEWKELVPAYYRAVRLMDYLAGYPVFLEARSLNMSEFAELLERLASTWLVSREKEGIPPPSGTEVEVTREGDLSSLHHLLSFYTDDFVRAIIEEAERLDALEREEEENKKRSAANGKGHKLIEAAQVEGGSERKGSWKEERDRIEAERRKIDPSYATYNTARAEVALAWMQIVVLPEKEKEEEELPVQQQQHAAQGSSSSFANGGGGGGSSQAMGGGSGSGSGASGPASTAQLLDMLDNITGEREGRSSSSEGKGKGKGKGRALES